LNLLIIEDEPELSRNISHYLLQSLYVCETAADLRTAKNKLAHGHYDCIILDIGLPDGSGLDLLKQLKRSDQADGVVIISARNSLNDKVAGLKLGADDYLTKPFTLADSKSLLTLGRLTIDLVAMTASTEAGELPLTRKEYEILVYFVHNRNRVVTKESIVDHLWEASVHLTDNFDFIYAHIKNLRKKLADAGCPDYIRSVHGMGYKLSI